MTVYYFQWWYPACLSSCPCCLEESHRIDGIALNSLEEVEITSFTYVEMEFLECLSRCYAAIIKRLVFRHGISNYAPPTKEIREKVRSMWHPKVEAEFYNVSDWGVGAFRLIPQGS